MSYARPIPAGIRHMFVTFLVYLKVSDNISAFISGRQNQDQAGEMFLLKWIEMETERTF